MSYLAIPRAGAGPGVMVLHSWWGLNSFFKGLCDRFAESGYVALAPDLFAGRTAATPAEAKNLRAHATATRRRPAYKLLIESIEDLRAHKATSNHDRIGVVGFSMGGHWALWLAQRQELPIAATVAFYAARNGDYSISRSDFLFHFAETDDWVSAASRRRMTKSLEAAGRPFRCWDYPGTGHWFFEADPPESYSAAAAALAWDRTLAFLGGRIGSPG